MGFAPQLRKTKTRENMTPEKHIELLRIELKGLVAELKRNRSAASKMVARQQVVVNKMQSIKSNRNQNGTK